MTPKEKAEEMIDKYQFVYIQNYTSMFEVKQCALIAVDEILDIVKHIDVDSEDYWQEVKQEIINL
jgi:hypothetical protein